MVRRVQQLQAQRGEHWRFQQLHQPVDLQHAMQRTSEASIRGQGLAPRAGPGAYCFLQRGGERQSTGTADTTSKRCPAAPDQSWQFFQVSGFTRRRVHTRWPIRM